MYCLKSHCCLTKTSETKKQYGKFKNRIKNLLRNIIITVSLPQVKQGERCHCDIFQEVNAANCKDNQVS